MNIDINLAIRRSGQNSAVIQNVKKLRLFAVSFLFIVAIASIGIFLVIAASPLGALREQEQQAAVALNKFQAQFGKNLLIKNQLQAISQVIKGRPSLSSSIEALSRTLPPGVVLNSAVVTTDMATIGIEASSTESLEQLFQTLSQPETRRILPPTITTSGISLSPITGRYTLSIIFQ